MQRKWNCRDFAHNQVRSNISSSFCICWLSTLFLECTARNLRWSSRCLIWSWNFPEKKGSLRSTCFWFRPSLHRLLVFYHKYLVRYTLQITASCVLETLLSVLIAPASPNSPLETEKLSFEGKVIQKLECKPTGRNLLFQFLHENTEINISLSSKC